MDIAIVSDAIYPYNKGGKEKRIYEVSTRLASKGHKVTIYCMKWWKGKDVRIENGVTLHAISQFYPLYYGKRRSIKEAVFFGLSCFKLIEKRFDLIDADHMPHLVLFPLKIVALLKGKKLIVTWNEVWGRKYWVEYMGILGNFSYIIEKLSVLTPSKIISISNHTTNKLKTELSSKKDIVTIPNGIDYEAIQKIKPSKNNSDIIFAGRLLSHKNVGVLIKSIVILKASTPNIKCIIIGNGPEKKHLVELVARLNLKKNVLFLNFFENQEELYSIMKSSRVFVLPSTREGFGIVVIEANACGIPVITIDHKDNAAKDLIEIGKNGYICELNEQDIARKITESFGKNLDNKVIQNCEESSRKYDWSKIVNEVESVYKNEINH